MQCRVRCLALAGLSGYHDAASPAIVDGRSCS
jgi:hypothetical protein